MRMPLSSGADLLAGALAVFGGGGGRAAHRLAFGLGGVLLGFALGFEFGVDRRGRCWAAPGKPPEAAAADAAAARAGGGGALRMSFSGHAVVGGGRSLYWIWPFARATSTARQPRGMGSAPANGDSRGPRRMVR